ncbi:MAG: DUF1289 domain-containing protein [Burkholderiaceae bacterium]
MTPLEALAALAGLAEDPTALLMPSPCISICRMDDSNGLCLGCHRTIEEIIAWGRLPENGKRVVWRNIRRRAGIVQETPGSVA